MQCCHIYRLTKQYSVGDDRDARHLMESRSLIYHPCTICSKPTPLWCSRCQCAWYCTAEHMRFVRPRLIDPCSVLIVFFCFVFWYRTGIDTKKSASRYHKGRYIEPLLRELQPLPPPKLFIVISKQSCSRQTEVPCSSLHPHKITYLTNYIRTFGAHTGQLSDENRRRRKIPNYSTNTTLVPKW